MEQLVDRYYRLKQEQKEIERELTALRSEVIEACRQAGVAEWEAGGYVVKLVHQTRKEYDEDKLYEALPDRGMWRLVSKPDASRVASLIGLNVITEQQVAHTFAEKPVTLLLVEKK